MREQFDLRRRRNPPVRPDKKQFIVDAPPELPRSVEPSVFQKAVPWVMGLALIGLLVMMVMTGMRMMNPIYLIFMAMMLFSMFGSMQNFGGRSEMTTPEVNSERAEYLRYLSGNAELIREAAEAQRAAALWSHPDPGELDAYIGSVRMWERDRGDVDYLKIRIGLDEVKLDNMIKPKHVESELDLEPVTKTALHHLRVVQQSIRDCPKPIDFAGTSKIVVYGEREIFEQAVRAWICQLTCWHAPNTAAVAVVSPELEARWGWAKWLPHTEGPELDGAGPGRYLGRSVGDVEGVLGPLLKDRGGADTDTAGEHKHVVLVVDDPEMAESGAVKRIAALNGVTVIAYRAERRPDRDYQPHPRELLIHLDQGVDAAMMRSWKDFRWRLFCERPDLLGAAVARHLAQQMSRFDVAHTAMQTRQSAAAQTLLSLLGVPNAASLDRATLWEPRSHSEYLKVPLGVQPSGAPQWIDLKDEAEGGNGPHGLMIGMTGSGKTTTLRALIFALFVKHSPDEVQAILADFKGEAGFDEYSAYPHVVAVISNMEEKRSMVERFGDTLHGTLERRERTFKAAGQRVKGAAFQSLVEYNQARATSEGADLPPMPTMFVIVDEFSLMLKDHPHMAEVFDTVTRKGRSLGVFFLFASQTLDEGSIKKIPDNTHYRIGLKVASSSISRQVIGAEEAFHIPDGKNVKGTMYFVRAPGAEPVKCRGFLLPDRYEPPRMTTRRVVTAKPRMRLFTAGRVDPDPDTVYETETVAETTVAGAPRSLVLTVGPQLAAAYGKTVDQLWSPPLDNPIPLDDVCSPPAGPGVSAQPGGPRWPLGKVDQPRLLTHSVLTYGVDAGNVGVVGMPGSGRSTVLQTFVLSAALRYSPREAGFYILNYGGPPLAAVKDLPHVGALSGPENKELMLRIFGDLDAVLAGRLQTFARHNVASMAEYRHRRSQGDRLLDDGYPVDIFLLVDGWEKFLADNTSQMHPKNPLQKNVGRLLDAGYGIHVAVSAADWTPLLSLQDRLACRWELKLAQTTGSQVRPRLEDKMARPQDRIPADQPGRGINMKGEVIRFAVGRTDATPSIENLDDKVRDTATAIIAAHRGARVPAPPLLPVLVDPATLGQHDLGGEHIAIGVRGRDLQPLVVDFAADPLLGVYGDSKKGKTEFMRHVLRTVVARRGGPHEALVCVFDTSRRLMEETQLLHEGEDYYETDPVAIAERVRKLAVVLATRMPPQDLTWEQKRAWTFDGPVIYLLVDDLDAIPASVLITPPPAAPGVAPAPAQQVKVWEPLIPYLASARDIGLRVIMTHKAAGAATSEVIPSSLPGQISTQRSNRILLGSRNRDQVGGVKFEDAVAGRGFVIATSEANEGYVQLSTAGGQRE